jgi:hypothetical protein
MAIVVMNKARNREAGKQRLDELLRDTSRKKIIAACEGGNSKKLVW